MTDESDTGRLIGYARVSTSEQRVEMQINALLKAGVQREHIFSESVSGVNKKRPALADAILSAESGDTLVVWKLDRVGRSMLDLLKLIQKLEADGIRIRSLTEGFDTQTLAGRLVMHVLTALAEFERGLIRERTQAGIENARSKGVRFGQRKRVSDKQIATAWERVHEQDETRVVVAADLGITTHQLARRLKEHEDRVAAGLPPEPARKRTKKKATTKRRATN